MKDIDLAWSEKPMIWDTIDLAWCEKPMIWDTIWLKSGWVTLNFFSLIFLDMLDPGLNVEENIFQNFLSSTFIAIVIYKKNH